MAIKAAGLGPAAFFIYHLAMTASIVVLGARGRMGQMVLTACANRIQAGQDLKVVGAVESPSSPFLGQTSGVDGIEAKVTADLASLLKPGVVVIDFTSPEASMAALEACRKAGAAHVLCTTGLSAAQKQAIADAAKTIPVVFAPNMSMGVTIMFRGFKSRWMIFCSCMYARPSAACSR